MYDYLIIGHGLAGAVLSQKLLEREQKIMVLDQPDHNHSSVVAAGIFNPITGRKMFKTWRADQFFPELTSFYPELETKLEAAFYYPIGVYRPYFAIEDQNDWEAKKSDAKFDAYIAQTTTSNISAHQLHDPHGGLFLKQAGYVNIVELLNANKKYLIDKGSYRETMFYEKDLKCNTDHFSFGDLKFKKIIFCNGIHAHKSEWFQWLPFHPVKGEMIDIELKKRPETIYNRGVFMLPFAGGHIRVGSTYHHHFDDMQPTETGQNELKEKLSGLLKEQYEIKGSRAGIRPATKDRRPFIGKHPDNEHIYVFNGFGSKGVSLIPNCSKLFTAYLLDGEALDAEVDVSRYYSHYPIQQKN
ncbi:Glycine/D-amino acid oxidase [Reichenbachiella faecimaris]|uniref:Glycine/D-amino acid oxidase n=1 Tax=Reichenbachiella faecimaris TaxID=692418 RepID=A0A1W2GEF3_REIFA|nr:FAD-dependent oxidoreductase [Reichenbachiella faecimaris]SMD35050.1 Glycine/D-amino acid oxidase [Reichenbachiella faecimaris]